MSEDLKLALGSTEDAPRDARRAIAASFPALAPLVQVDLKLVVSELVSNAVVHGGTGPDDAPIQLELQCDDGVVRVSVVHPGPEFARPARPGGGESDGGDSNGGWGLFLVDRIAERWGIFPAPGGTCVWFEVSTASETPAPA